MTESRKLLTFEFVGLCMVNFLLACHLSGFYNLYNYLHTLGIPAELRGLVISVFALTAMILYLVGSPFLNLVNATRVTLLGIVILVLHGLGYLFVSSLPGLLALRMLNGAGQFCMTAGAITLFVSVIPQAQSGQAFGLYAVAFLLGYAAVPAIMDTPASFIPSPPYAYAVTTAFLLPAAWIIWQIRRRHPEWLGTDPARGHLPPWVHIRANITRLPIALLILLNISYFANWSSLFFLFKGFAQQRGLVNVGAFFTVQMLTNIVLLLLAGRLFDLINKAWLVTISFIIIAMGYLALNHLPGTWAVPLVGVIFGLGMGVSYPAINGLMFVLSEPRFRALNANLMLCALQAGFFFGPVVGGALVAYSGYHTYFLVSSGLALAVAALCPVLAAKDLAAPAESARPAS